MAFIDTLKKWLNVGDRALGFDDTRMYNPGFIGWFKTYQTYRNDYENAFASIRVIASRFAKIEPYAIDSAGESVASNVLDRIYTPNTAMSAYDFREALAVMSLIHNKVYIQAHFRSKRRAADSLVGFTLLEGVSEHTIDGKVEYWLGSGEKLTNKDVMVLKSINPYDLSAGFSHAYAARRWTAIDDYIADYQAGFFKNGAVPTGMFRIRAKSRQDFIDIKNNLQNSHRGAGNNGNVSYDWIQETAEGDSKSVIEWIPFNVANKDLALKEIFEEANKKIDSVYGVPASLRGVNDTNTYASVRVDEQIFYENTLDPFTLKVWSKFTHELNRITGGLGVAITYDLEAPQIADELKVRAEAKQVQALTVNTLIQNFTIESVADYIETGEIRSLIEKPIEVELPEVTEPGDLKDTPDQKHIAHLTKAGGHASHADHICTDCNHYSVEKKTLESDDYFFVKAMPNKTRTGYENKLKKVVKSRMVAQIKAYSETLSKAVDNPISEEEDDLLAKEILAVLLALIALQGAREHEANIKTVLASGVDIGLITPFTLSEANRKEYNDYVVKLSKDYNDQTRLKIIETMKQAREQGLTAGDIKKKLEGLIEEYRINRIARTEINKAGNESSLYSMKQIAEETGTTVYKVWESKKDADVCPYCKSMDGTRIGLDEVFVKKGDQVVGADGSVFQNNWEDLDSGTLHANCRCRQVYEVAQ